MNIDDSDIVVTTVDDALLRDHQMLVLVGSEVMLLSPVPSEIARICAGGMAVGDLGEHLLSVFGPPADGTSVEDKTRVRIGELLEAGVVRIASGDTV